MTTELTTEQQPGTAVGQHTGSDSMSMLQIIADAARDPTVDAQKMVTLADLALKLKDHEKQERFNRDKVAALLEMPMITKKGAIVIPGKDGGQGRVQGRFAKFEDIMRVVQPILKRHNLAIDFRVGHEGAMVTCAPVLRHVNGFTDVGEQMIFPIDSSGSKNNTQGVGSAASYAKRQTLKACLNIVEIGEDDDGYGAGGYNLELDPDQQQLVDAGTKAAKDGKLDEWFHSLPSADRGWLAASGQYDKLTAGPKEQQQGAGSAETYERAQEMEQAAKRTPEQAVAGYVERTQQAATLADLQALQADEKTVQWLAKVKAKRPDLHEQILAANTAAYQRLSA